MAIFKHLSTPYAVPACSVFSTKKTNIEELSKQESNNLLQSLCFLRKTKFRMLLYYESYLYMSNKENFPNLLFGLPHRF